MGKTQNIGEVLFPPKILKKVDFSVQIFFFGANSVPIVNPIQGCVASSMVEPCYEGPCCFCLCQSPLRTLLTCHETDAASLPSVCAKSQVTLVKSKEETGSMGTAAASAAVGQAGPVLCWHKR